MVGCTANRCTQPLTENHLPRGILGSTICKQQQKNNSNSNFGLAQINKKP